MACCDGVSAAVELPGCTPLGGGAGYQFTSLPQIEVGMMCCNSISAAIELPACTPA